MIGGWGELILALGGCIVLALVLGTIGEWLICGFDEMAKRFGIAARVRREDGACECGTHCGCDQLGRSPRWVSEIRKRQEP